MKIGFETIGNATLICYDGKPILATDPWIEGSAYFGSWGMSHVVPEEQKDAVKHCPYVWISHGHPDHLNPDSMDYFKGKTILLPAHIGGRINHYLSTEGFTTQVVETKKWIPLSDHIKIMTLPDYNQDAVLLIDINGRLILNLNDASARGWNRFLRRTIKSYPISILLRLTGWGGGDADMKNYFDEEGRRVPPLATKEKERPLGKGIAAMVDSWGATHFAPFSSLHRYQRSDSIWANAYTTPQDAYFEGYASGRSHILPVHMHYDCESDIATPIHPAPTESVVFEPEAFGDNWSDSLTAEDVKKISGYFNQIEHLKTYLGFINFRVGGRDHAVDINRQRFSKGITFEVPRHSLMTAVEYEIFDDLMIGNFMKTTLHGTWTQTKLYPDFIPYVAKYADNGGAKSRDELSAYFRAYYRQAPIDYLFDRFEEQTKNFVRARIRNDSTLYEASKQIYWTIKKTLA